MLLEVKERDNETGLNNEQPHYDLFPSRSFFALV